MGAKYGAPIEEETAYDIMRARLFEMGHSLHELDSMSVRDYCTIIGYLEGDAKVNGSKKVNNALAGKK